MQSYNLIFAFYFLNFAIHWSPFKLLYNITSVSPEPETKARESKAIIPNSEISLFSQSSSALHKKLQSESNFRNVILNKGLIWYAAFTAHINSIPWQILRSEMRDMGGGNQWAFYTQITCFSTTEAHPTLVLTSSFWGRGAPFPAHSDGMCQPGARQK